MIKKLSDREHILKRTGMYLGSVEPEKQERHIFDGEKFVKKEVEIVPALIKIVEEIIDNSVDESIRTDFKFANNIKVDLDDNYFKVKDNGRGIPVKKNEDGEYMPKVAWGYARAGSNFENDENRVTIGLNGVGSFGTNVMSKYFKGISQDGEHKIICEWKDNANPSFYNEKITKNKSKGIEVYVEPDFRRFNRNSFTKDEKDVIITRLVILALTYPEIKFYYNSERIQIPKEVIF